MTSFKRFAVAIAFACAGLVWWNPDLPAQTEVFVKRAFQAQTFVGADAVTCSSYLSAASKGRLCYNSATNKWMVSENGGAYTNLLVSAGDSTVRQTFRNLTLRTGPDNNVDATTVTLLHADEIVTSDGVRRTPADNLAATITTSGINGLRASQSEAASTWYKVMYTYGGSGEGVYLEQAKDYLNDTSFTTATDASRALRLATSTATDKLAQGIQFATAKPMEFIDGELVRVGSVSGNIWFTLESDSGGNPSAVLATSVKLDASKVSTSNQSIRIPFYTPYTVAASTQYHLVLQGDYTRSDTVYIAWRGVAAGGYANGSAKEYNGTSWGAASGVGDFNFKAYVTRNDNTVTPPTGYATGYAQVGWVYNDGSSNFVPFVQQDRDVNYAPIVSGGTTTATIQTLQDFSALVPPAPIRGWLALGNSGGGVTGYIGGLPRGFGTTTVNSITVPDMGEQYEAGYQSGTATPRLIQTEMQAIYASVAATTGRFYVHGFQW